jgi:hypothetical protein
MFWATVWAIFFTTSSCHPVKRELARSLVFYVRAKTFHVAKVLAAIGLRVSGSVEIKKLTLDAGVPTVDE